MMRSRVGGALLGALVIACGLLSSAVHAAGFVDPVDSPAVTDNRATTEPLVAITHAGSRLVAVGLRGLIIYSDERGAIWHQARVPVQSDLTAVDFLDQKTGWVAGHNGVILHTTDGGQTWVKQFDGRDNLAFKAIYQKRVDAGDASARPYVQVMELNTREGPALPYLDILFENAHDGYAVGAYGMIMATHDGGSHWLPWLDHIDNPHFLFLNAISSIGGEVYIAGEAGKVYKLDRARQYFIATDTSYTGSLFGITGKDKLLLAYGMLGHLYRSIDAGASWKPVQTGLQSSFSDATLLNDGRVVLASQSGRLLEGNNLNDAFESLAVKNVFPAAGVTASGGHSLAVVGPGGVIISRMP